LDHVAPPRGYSRAQQKCPARVHSTHAAINYPLKAAPKIKRKFVAHLTHSQKELHQKSQSLESPLRLIRPYKSLDAQAKSHLWQISLDFCRIFWPQTLPDQQPLEQAVFSAS
jgi:hypothetical protein